MPKPTRTLPPPPPGEPTTCAHGGATPASGWQWFSGLGTWERVCRSHTTTTAMRRGDYVPDEAVVARQAPEPERTS
ncbi:hypothetical protein ACBJ59_61190 [Nonomuraea sp. MTCD27]|uniref:hypothetical protein n=1 Tax=Nonomuraea sp. MTCD27 TaxID=1676747 RepID=UPI0035C19C3B